MVMFELKICLTVICGPQQVEAYVCSAGNFAEVFFSKIVKKVLMIQLKVHLNMTHKLSRTKLKKNKTKTKQNFAKLP